MAITRSKEIQQIQTQLLDTNKSMTDLKACLDSTMLLSPNSPPMLCLLCPPRFVTKFNDTMTVHAKINDNSMTPWLPVHSNCLP